MTVRSQHLKIVGALGAAALTVGALTTPALAAGKDLTFTCDVLGPTATTLTSGAPAKMVAGQTAKPKVTLVVHLSSGQTTVAGGLGTHVSGTITADGKKKTYPYKVTIPNTAITPGVAQDISASGKGTLTATKVGTLKVTAGTISAVLNLTGGMAGPTTVPQTCTAPTDGTQNLGTVAVGKDKTKSKVSSKVSGKKATVTDKVKSHFGLKATGKVKFTFKKGSKTVTASAKIKKGAAKVSKTLTSGKWSVSAAYPGNKNLKGSTGKGTVTVK